MSNISYYSIKTISLQKIKEFFIEFQYTIIAPLVSTIIFIILLSTINNYYVLNNHENNYLEFLVPGVVIMVVMQTSYQNISESLIYMKQIGSFNDYLVSPISRIEIFIAFLVASIFIGLFVGIINIFFLKIFIEFKTINYFFILYYLILTSLIFSSIGSIVGFLFFTWDVQQSINSFIVIPISYLSGTFFSINSINLKWVFFFKLNPFYKIVNNFRDSFYGSNNFIFIEELILFFITFLFVIISIIVFKKGYKVIC